MKDNKLRVKRQFRVKHHRLAEANPCSGSAEDKLSTTIVLVTTVGGKGRSESWTGSVDFHVHIREQHGFTILGHTRATRIFAT